MTTYGVNNGNGIPFTGYTFTLSNGPANAEGTSGTVAFNGFTQGDERIAKMLRNGGAGLRLRALMFALTGNTPGGTATASKKQIKWEQGSPGGLIPIESITLLNRATTAADVTAIDALLFRSPTPATYVADASGNGGGGKQQVGGGAY